jgi:hypothetical protein
MRTPLPEYLLTGYRGFESLLLRSEYLLSASANPSARRSWLPREQRPLTLPREDPYRDFVEESRVELTWLCDDETPETPTALSRE